MRTRSDRIVTSDRRPTPGHVVHGNDDALAGIRCKIDALQTRCGILLWDVLDGARSRFALCRRLSRTRWMPTRRAGDSRYFVTTRSTAAARSACPAALGWMPQPPLVSRVNSPAAQLSPPNRRAAD